MNSYFGGAWKQMGEDKVQWATILMPFLIAAIISADGPAFLFVLLPVYGMVWAGFAEKWRERKGEGK